MNTNTGRYQVEILIDGRWFFYSSPIETELTRDEYLRSCQDLAPGSIFRLKTIPQDGSPDTPPMKHPNKGRTREQVERLVTGTVMPSSTDREALKPIIDHIVETGDCVWHAVATVRGTRCYCAHCYPVWGGPHR